MDDDAPRNTRRPADPGREERSLATDAATTFVTGLAGGAGTAAGVAGAQKIIQTVSDKLGSNDPPSAVVLPPGVSKD